MSRLSRRALAEMTPEQQEAYHKIASIRGGGKDGRIGGPFDAWILNPEMGSRIVGLGDTFRHRTSVDRRFIELAILVTGQFWRAQFEWWAHEPMAREAGVPEAVIQAIKAGQAPDFEDPRDASCYRLCRALHDTHQVDDATYAAAVAHFGDQGVSEIVAVSGFYTLVSMTLNTFRVPLPGGAELPFPD